VVVCVKRGGTLYVANAGDSRCVLGHMTGPARMAGKPLTSDHTPIRCVSAPLPPLPGHGRHMPGRLPYMFPSLVRVKSRQRLAPAPGMRCRIPHHSFFFMLREDPSIHQLETP